MYAVIQVGAKQFKIKEGDTIAAQRQAGEVGKDVTLNQVLLFSEGELVRVGAPFLKDVKVTARVVEHDEDQKVKILKYRRRKNSSSRRGHRQKLTALSITKIEASN